VLSFDVVVQKDESVDSIAQKLGLPRDVLLSANGGRAARSCPIYLRRHEICVIMQSGHRAPLLGSTLLCVRQRFAARAAA
jgi:hypothetical protein